MTERKIDFKEEARRQRYIESLYAKSGRNNGLYSGLHLARIDELLEMDRQRLEAEEQEAAE